MTDMCTPEYWPGFGMTRENLMATARKYRERAYAPYSNFLVGAALLMSDGEVIGGCNVENASYGMSICAERVAMTSAVAQGKREPLALAVAGAPNAFCPPCGACRQYLSEFNPDLEVLLMRDGALHVYTLNDLLPHRFHLEG